MADYPRKNTGSSDNASSRSKTPNFSRPQPQASALRSGQRSNQDRHVHIIDAFHEPNRDLPSEPRFSEESEQTDMTSSENSANSNVAWDGHSGELDSKSRKKRYDDQRYATTGTHIRPTTARSNTSSSDQTFNLELTDSGVATSSSSKNQIMKRVSVDQRSERISTSTDQWEDTASHHTVSESGDSGSFDSEGRWQSSDYDTSALTDAEIRKLEKKGINPALYMEMKAAKKGKKWTPHLLGNGFLN